MKKLTCIILFAFLTCNAFSQPACLKDVWQTLDRNQLGKAKTEMDKCMKGNESSADAWLLKANVYLRYYAFEADQKISNPAYEIKVPDAILEAFNAFYKAFTLNQDVKVMSRMFGPKEGQITCAPAVHDLGVDEMKKKNYEKAIECFNTAIRGYNLTDNKQSIARAYIDMGTCYYLQNDTANYLKSLDNAARLSPPIPDLYIILYNLYKEKNDTLQCDRIIKLGKRAVPDTLAGAAELKVYELDYLAITGRTEQIPELALKLFEANKNDTNVLYYLAINLVNNKFYELATTIIEHGLTLVENPLDFNKQMAFRYFYETVHYQVLIDEAFNEQKWALRNELEAQRKKLMELSHEWLEKVYAQDKEDVDNNIMLKRIKVVLEIPVPDELNEKVNSYHH